METKKALIVVSNHPVDKWTPEQKIGWDVIEYIAFPIVPPQLSSVEIYEQYGSELLKKISELYQHYSNIGFSVFVSIQGDFSLTAMLIIELFKIYGNVFTFPTTERLVEERIKDDGTIEKISTFKFVRWR